MKELKPSFLDYLTLKNKVMLARAIEIASSAHVNQKDKQGVPYILHPLWVMNKVRHLGESFMIVGILHDLVENTNWTIERLREEGFSEEILHALELLDMRVGDYDKNIRMISTNDLATQVKLRDLEHNSKITRLKDVREKDFERIKKYNKAFNFLKPFRR